MGGIRNQWADKIQGLWPHVRQDVLTRMNAGGENFPVELGTQLCGVRDVHCRLAQGMPQFALAVETKLVQNGQRNDTQEGTIKELFASSRNLGARLGQNHQGNVLMYQKVAKAERQMDGIGKVIGGEVIKSFTPNARSVEVKIHEGAKFEAPLPREPSNIERSAKLPPCLALGQDDRRLGVWAKSEQPPWTEDGQKAEFDTDSITAEKERAIQPPKAENDPIVWTSTSNCCANEWRTTKIIRHG